MADESPHPYKIQQAMDFIRRAIADHRFPQGSTLPPIRRLTALAGVSYVTMWKAVSILGQQGVLTVVRGQLVKVAGGLVDESDNPTAVPDARRYAAGQAWHRLRDQIERDVLNGAFAPGYRLPLSKQLTTRYRASHPTIAKALRELQRTGILSASGRGFSVPHVSASGGRITVCFLTHREYLDRLFAGNPAGHNYLPIVEIEASRRGLRVVIEECLYKNDQLVPLRRAAAFPAANDFLGYVYILNSPTGSERIMRMLGKSGKPVSVLEEYGKWPYAGLTGNSPLFKIFPVGSRAAPGSAVARFLIGLGHRRIAYLSADHHARWSTERLEGLRDGFARAGYHDAVRPYTIDIDIWGIEAARMETGRGPAAGAQSQPIGAEEDRRSRLLAIAYKDADSKRRHLLALFKEALSDKGITAWVAANDNVAILASDFLHRAGVDVPRRTSLISFDNTVQALAYQISSYDLNLPAIVGAALSHIVEFSAGARRNGPLCVEIDGLTIDRMSVGKPRENRAV
jgi:DNA-binding transcriptional regulator YhcF (GntR family)